MKHLKTLLFGMLLNSCLPTYSQVLSPCFFDQMQDHILDDDSRGGGGYDYVEYVNAGIPMVDRICPVVVHVIHNNGVENISDCQIEDAIAQANEQLSSPFDSHIRLELARMDPNGNCTTGINRIQVDDPRVNPGDDEGLCVMTDAELKQLSMWSQDRYINVYIVGDIVNTDENCIASPSAAGYVTSIPLIESTDGIVMKHDHFGNSGTAINNDMYWIHEIGHYFYLYHPWGNNNGSCDNCHLISQCLTHGDRVCDTNPTTTQATVNCFFNSNFCGCQSPDLYDYGTVMYPSETYMSYNPSCQFFFSQGQITRMQWCLYVDRINLGNNYSQELAGLFESPAADIDYLACDLLKFSIDNCWSAQTVEWDFGDGSDLAFGPEVTHNYACDGNYEVICRIYRCPDYPEIITNEITVDCGSTLPSFNTSIVDETCYDGCNGAITISGYNGTLNWIGPNDFSSTSNNLINLCPGNYYGSFGLPGNCYSQMFTVLESATEPLIVDITDIASATCFNCCDGVANIEASGGTSPYTYTIDGIPTSTTIVDLCNGNYQIEVTDSYGCTSSTELIITEPELLEFTSFETQNNDECDNTCGGGVIFTWAGGYAPYDIFLNDVQIYNNHPSILTTLNQLCNGDYTVTIVDNLGNIIEQTFTVTGISAIFLEDVILNDGDFNPFIAGGEYFVDGDIIIQSGSFIFSEVTLRFVYNSDIIIEEGAHLTIEYSNLTSCAQYWRGIEVKSSTSTPTPPGSLFIEKSKIYFAAIAIQSYDDSPVYTSGAWFDEDGNTVYYWIPTLDQFTAGNIYCVDTEFNNNKRALSLGSSIIPIDQMNNQGFSNCVMKVNDDLYNHFNYQVLDDCDLQNANFQSHVYLSNVKNFNFRGCAFSNEMTDESHFECGWRSRGSGISASNAVFNVEDEGVTRSLFHGFHTGISALVTGWPWNGAVVNHAVFHHNKIGMLFNNVCYHDVVNCHVNVGEPTGIALLDLFLAENPDAQHYEGLVQIHGNFFLFGDNYFQGTPGPHQPIGIRIRDTKALDFSEVHNNEFHSFYIANKADGKNFNDPMGSGYYSGLRYTCQHNYDNYIDFEVDAFSEDIEEGIGSVQQGDAILGEPDDPDNASGAGCSFSAAAFSHFLNYGDYDIVYRHEISEPSPAVNVTGISSNEIVTFPNNCDPFDDISAEFTSNEDEEVTEGNGNNDENSPNTWQADLVAWINNVGNAKPSLSWIQNILESLIDGGSTADLVNNVNWSTDTWTVRLDLLAKSPYLSKDVLINVADNTNLIPHAIALEIFIANPEIIRDKSFIEYLQIKDDPLPQFMIDILLLSQDITTLRKSYGELYALLKSYIEKTNGKIARVYLRDPSANQESLYKVKSESGLLIDEFEIINELLNHNEIANAEDRNSTISSRIKTLGVQNKLELQAFSDWFEFRKDLINNQTEWSTLSESQMNQLIAFSNMRNTWTGVQARSILMIHFNKQYYIPPAFDKLNADLQKSKRANIAVEQPIITVFPTPANDLVSLTYNDQVTDVSSQATLTIFDSMGKEVKSINFTSNHQIMNLEIAEWPTGIYLYELTLPFNRRVTGKFEVLH
jgi:Pregnancy-associated plasma protein-A/Secretion system C-terminal sorting domain/PKD domain